MTKVESVTTESLENSLKSRAVQLIRDTYGKARGCKSVNNSEGEDEMTTLAGGMSKMAEVLRVLTINELKKLHAEYWESRDDIPQNFPDRFGE